MRVTSVQLTVHSFSRVAKSLTQPSGVRLRYSTIKDAASIGHKTDRNQGIGSLKAHGHRNPTGYVLDRDRSFFVSPYSLDYRFVHHLVGELSDLIGSRYWQGLKVNRVEVDEEVDTPVPDKTGTNQTPIALPTYRSAHVACAAWKSVDHNHMDEEWDTSHQIPVEPL